MSKYIIFITLLTGVTYYFWLGFKSPIGDLHITISNDQALVAMEDSLIAYYKDKIEESKKSPINNENIRVLLQDLNENFFFPNPHSPMGDDRSLLKLIASVSSPVIKGQKLQASDIFIIKGNVDLVYVSYNMVGPKSYGGVQILSLDETRDHPVKLEQTLLFKDSEFHGVFADGNYLYLAGATTDPSFKSPAFLEILKLKKGVVTNLRGTRIDLPSYAATSVIKGFNRVFVSSGDTMGGITSFSEKKSWPVGIFSAKELRDGFYPLEDPRDLSLNGHSLYAVTGGQSSLWTRRFNGNGRGGLDTSLPLMGANVPESKSSIIVNNNFAYLGLGDGGTQIRSLANNRILGRIPALELKHLDDALTVTNSVEIHANELFTADGEGGSRLFKIKSNGDIEQLTRIRFSEGTSVNSIKKEGNLVVFATGLGGIKVALQKKSNSKKTR